MFINKNYKNLKFTYQFLPLHIYQLFQHLSLLNVYNIISSLNNSQLQVKVLI